MRNISVKSFAYRPEVQEEMLPKERAFCSVESTCLCNYGKEHHEEHFCEIDFNLGQYF